MSNCVSSKVSTCGNCSSCGKANILPEQTISVPIIVKGGEKEMVSEWDRLMQLPKEDLVIQLVYWKNMYGILRVCEDDSCPWPCV